MARRNERWQLAVPSKNSAAHLNSSRALLQKSARESPESGNSRENHFDNRKYALNLAAVHLNQVNCDAAHRLTQFIVDKPAEHSRKTRIHKFRNSI